MKITCSQQELEKATSKAQRAVATKSSIPSLEGIYLKAYNHKISLCGYNLELGITTTIEETNISEEGEAILNAKLFSDIIRKLKQEEVTIETNNQIATIKSGRSKFSLATMDTAEYPELPQIKDPQKLTINSTTLKSMIKQTLFAVSEIDNNPIYTGTLFEINDHKIKLVSVDGYRLAIRTEPTQIEISSKFIIPGKTLNEILKILPEEETEIDISTGRSHIIFELEDCTLTSRLLEGNFLNYEANIPQNHTTQVLIPTKEFTDTLERVSLIITDRTKSPLRLIFNENKTKLCCTTGLGQANDEIETQITGEPLEIGFNNKFLIEALKNTDSDQVKIQMNGSLNPMKIIPKDGDSFLFLVLPVRLTADGDD